LPEAEQQEQRQAEEDGHRCQVRRPSTRTTPARAPSAPQGQVMANSQFGSSPRRPRATARSSPGRGPPWPAAASRRAESSGTGRVVGHGLVGSGLARPSEIEAEDDVVPVRIADGPVPELYQRATEESGAWNNVPRHAGSTGAAGPCRRRVLFHRVQRHALHLGEEKGTSSTPARRVSGAVKALPRAR